jgi:SPP1 family phage portal protein
VSINSRGSSYMFTISESTEINADVIKAAIDYNEEQRKRYDRLEKYYMGKHDILERRKQYTRINNKIVVNHAKFITDTNIGFLLGHPVEYQVEQGNIDPVLELYRKQKMAALDHEIAKDSSIFGRQYEYTYANEDTECRSRDVDVRNCVLIHDDTMEHTKIAAVIYQLGEKRDTYERILLIDALTITQYANEQKKIARGESVDHFFGKVPVVDFRNNSELLGDFEIVLPLIDAYNIVQSDRVNDREQLVNAILAFYGVGLTSDQIQNLKTDRVLTDLPSDSKVEYLVKQANEGDSDKLREVIERDIHKISMTPNLSDENFVGNSSGVAIRYKLLAFEQSALNKERYFEEGLLERFELYNAFLNKRSNMPIVPPHMVDVVFKRNLPQNDLEISQMIMNLTGVVDTGTLISQLPFVKDASKVMEAMEKEKADQDEPEYATSQANVERAEGEVKKTVSREENGFLDRLSRILK